jgi:signal transduction histidine kinase
VLWLRARPRIGDALFAALVTVIALGAHALIRDAGDVEISDPTWWSPLLVLASTVPLAWRRRWPVAVLAAVSIPECVLQATEMIGAGFINVLIAAYSLGAYVKGRRLWVAGTISSACLIGFVAVGVAIDGVEVEALISTSVLYLGSIILGDNMRRRRERAEELVERAERAERERELLAAQQVRQERTRIAREMHDVVAHSLSVMIIQAGAARRQVRTNPDQATESLESIEATGREAMHEMRRILGVLRDDGSGRGEADGRAPQPSLGSLDDLVAASPDLPVTIHTDGDLATLPAAVELSAYRIVQEALTNVRRHAGPVRRVDVRVERSEHGLVVEVDDDGRGASVQACDPGFGLIGMRERVGVFGGRLDAGPRPGGGWRVRATFPAKELVA